MSFSRRSILGSASAAAAGLAASQILRPNVASAQQKAQRFGNLFASNQNNTGLVRWWKFDNGFAGADTDLSERVTGDPALAAVRGNSINGRGGWPEAYVSTRAGEHARYSVEDFDKTDGNGALVLNNDGTPVRPFILFEMPLNEMPWTGCLTFAIDPLRYDREGKTAWQRQGILINQWVGDERFDLVKVETVMHRAQGASAERPHLKLTVKTSEEQAVFLPVPEHLLRMFVRLKLYISLSADEFKLVLRGPKAYSRDRNVAENAEQAAWQVSGQPNGAYANVTHFKLLGTAHYVEFVELRFWDRANAFVADA